jgi:hypothetical protein
MKAETGDTIVPGKESRNPHRNLKSSRGALAWFALDNIDDSNAQDSATP